MVDQGVPVERSLVGLVLRNPVNVFGTFGEATNDTFAFKGSHRVIQAAVIFKVDVFAQVESAPTDVVDERLQDAPTFVNGHGLVVIVEQ